MDDPYALAAGAAATIRERFRRQSWRVSVVLGSGWQPAIDVLGSSAGEVAYDQLPGFAPPTAGGHRPSVLSIGDALVFAGRVHLYEGRSPNAVAHVVRTAAAAGCSTAILTNAAGGLRAEWPVGQPVLISDHLNLTGLSPLTGPRPPGGRFTDLTHAYSPRLRGLARTIDPTLPDGVYAGLPGPHFETPAEIRMLRTMGADLVGMSTVLETIAAVHAGMDVLAVSLVTNAAAGMTGDNLDAADVLRAAHAAAPRLGALLRDLIAGIVRGLPPRA